MMAKQKHLLDKHFPLILSVISMRLLFFTVFSFACFLVACTHTYRSEKSGIIIIIEGGTLFSLALVVAFTRAVSPGVVLLFFPPTSTARVRDFHSCLAPFFLPRHTNLATQTHRHIHPQSGLCLMVLIKF